MTIYTLNVADIRAGVADELYPEEVEEIREYVARRIERSRAVKKGKQFLWALESMWSDEGALTPPEYRVCAVYVTRNEAIQVAQSIAEYHTHSYEELPSFETGRTSDYVWKFAKPSFVDGYSSEGLRVRTIQFGGMVYS